MAQHGYYKIVKTNKPITVKYKEITPNFVLL